jgi:L-asparaginase
LNHTTVWPKVEIVMNYAGAGGALVDALAALGVHRVFVAGTGNGTMHQALKAALMKAQTQGIQVVRASRCTQGRVLPRADDHFAASNGLSPVKTRVDLMVRLMGLAT